VHADAVGLCGSCFVARLLENGVESVPADILCMFIVVARPMYASVVLKCKRDCRSVCRADGDTVFICVLGALFVRGDADVRCAARCFQA